MKLKVLLSAVFAAGLVASLAIASPPPGKGHGNNGNGKGHGKDAALSSSSTTSSTTTSSTTTSSEGKKTTLCHRTGSKKHPFVLIRVSRHAVPAHMRHGDVPAVGGKCPEGTTTTTTTTASTTTTTASTTTTH